MANPVVFEIVDIHSRRAERTSTIAPDAPPVPVTVWDVVAVAKGVDTNHKIEISTMNPQEAARYEVGGTIEVKMWSKHPMTAAQMSLEDDNVISIQANEEVTLSESLE